MKFKQPIVDLQLIEDAINFQAIQHTETIEKKKKIYHGKKSKNELKRKNSKQRQMKAYFANNKFKKYEQIKWYDQEKMSWPKKFMQKMMHHKMDFDQQSDEQVIRHAVDRGIGDLIQEITCQKMFSLQDTRYT